MATETGVLIVGAGPVGLALGTFLGAQGVESCIVDVRPGPTDRDESRAITWMPEGLLAADQLGVTETLRAQSVVRRRHEFRSHPSGAALLTLDMSRLRHPHPYTLNLPQGDSERVLESAALATGGVTVHRGWRITSAATDSSGVEAVLGAPDGRVKHVSARFGAACDGAGSSRRGVAAMLGITEHFSDYGAHSVVADVELAADPAPTDRSWIALSADRPIGAFCFGERRWRLIYRVNAGESGAQVTTDAFIRQQLHRAYPEAVLVRHLWASSFRLGQGQAHRYWRGRWALAGDAAHAMGPSAGAGMQLGVLGAWRLSQELAAALANESSWPRRAERYEQAQRHAAQMVQQSNARIFRNMTVTSHLFAGARATMLAIAGRIPPVALRMTADAALVGVAPTQTVGGFEEADQDAPTSLDRNRSCNQLGVSPKGRGS
jgi:2-polyprenyl-6-methoxyphenol hydroxylase-like FAD-dependent oxidoreductase